MLGNIYIKNKCALRSRSAENKNSAFQSHTLKCVLTSIEYLALFSEIFFVIPMTSTFFIIIVSVSSPAQASTPTTHTGVSQCERRLNGIYGNESSASTARRDGLYGRY